MKETIKTLLSKIDDPPEVEWKELGGDDQKALVYQEVWNEASRQNNFEIIDIIDKKNVLLYGLSAKKLNVADDGIEVSVLDIYDIALDPLYNPWNLDSARFIIHQNIFRPARDILADDRYTKEGRDELRIWADSPPGITQTAYNKDEWEKKLKRLESMGLDNGDFSHFAAGDRLINITEHFTSVWNPKKKEFERRVIVYAENCVELLNERLVDLIGCDEWPFVVWSEDPETLDVYPDSVADTMRVPNKVINVWFSQLIENRTLKNFQMHWYSPSQGYTAQTYTPGPGMMLAAPPGDDINKVLKPVEISGLEDTLEAINIITQIGERASGATAIEKGQSDEGEQTLGEVNVLVGKAAERATSMTKFYRRSWYELAVKWNRMMHANAPRIMNLTKTGANGKVYPKRVFRDDWVSEIGYEPVVTSTSEQEQNDIQTVQKWMFVTQQFPNNPALRKISQKRQLKILDLSPEELKEVEEGEKKMEEQMAIQAQAGIQPEVGGLMQQIQDQTAQLTA
jgi:hypothetical protein